MGQVNSIMCFFMSPLTLTNLLSFYLHTTLGYLLFNTQLVQDILLQSKHAILSEFSLQCGDLNHVKGSHPFHSRISIQRSVQPVQSVLYIDWRTYSQLQLVYASSKQTKYVKQLTSALIFCPFCFMHYLVYSQSILSEFFDVLEVTIS